jgi:hypothetical protein
MEIPVIINKCVFKNDNGFAILSATLDPYSPKYVPEMEKTIEECINKKYDTFTIISNTAGKDEHIEGGQFVFVGEIVFDKKYNCKQFKADFHYQDIPLTKNGLKKFLMTLPNIKESRSEAIINKFGVEGTFDILDNNVG